ncbi:MAG: ubiquinone/menaquinone biosynthesis methyltransferase [Acidobacteria bacterium]|nr:ubiquinone/menaquinone biosynthesis methyltransferase [Acidobacteriota bacterium]
MFGRIAHRYDLLNRVLSLGQDVLWRRALSRAVVGSGARRVLDVCTGTADVALALPEGVGVLGTDFCLPMLARGRRKVLARHRRVPLFAGDALALPVAGGSADAVTVAFGIRNFEDLEAGLAELVRVLRPGGWLFILEFSQPRGPLAPLLGWWARTVPPRVGRWLSGDPEAYSYLPASVSAFPSLERMTGVLEAIGLEEVSGRTLTGGVAALYGGRRPELWNAPVRSVAVQERVEVN